MAREAEATFEALLKKPRRQETVRITSTGDDGEPLELLFRMEAIGNKAYDALVAKYPPRAEDKKNGAIYDHERFAPALVAACSLSPKLSVDEAATLYESEDWSGGEFGALFLGALKLCNAGLDVPFSAGG